MHIHRYLAAVATLVLTTCQAWADVGMITQISGEVSITAGGSTQAAVPFFKVATGDKLTLAKTARVQVVYFGNGRQEVWQGGTQIEIGGLESKSTAKPEVTQLPPLVVNQLAKTPAAGQQGKVGMVRVRSMQNPDAAAHLDKQYNDLKAAATADDTTPEVYLLSGLIELKDFARAKTVLAELASQAAYAPLVAHFTPIVNAGAATAKP